MEWNITRKTGEDVKEDELGKIGMDIKFLLDF